MRILLQKWALFTVCGGHWASGESASGMSYLSSMGL